MTELTEVSSKMENIDETRKAYLNEIRKKYGLKKAKPSNYVVKYRMIRDRQWAALETMLEATQINHDKDTGEKIADMMSKQHTLSEEKVDDFIESFGKKKSAIA